MANGKPCGSLNTFSPSGQCIFHINKKGESNELQHHFKEMLFAKIQKENSDDTVKEIDFTEYRFPAYEFSNITFNKSVNFHKAIFQGYVSFKKCHFLGETNTFRGVRFEGNETIFDNVTFMGNDTGWGGVFFGSKEKTRFQDVHFESKQIAFDKSIFESKSTKFLLCEFKNKWLAFDGALFKGEYLIFKDVKLNCETLTFPSDFQSNYTHFNNCLLEGKLASFSQATFSKETVFVSTQFNSNETTFDNCRIKGEIEFQGNDGNLVFNSKATLRYLKIETIGSIIFRHVSFDQVELRGTDLRKIQFMDVYWYVKKNFVFGFPPWSKRKALYDETVLVAENKINREQAEIIKHAYRQLKQSHEDNRDYTRSNDFYFGEMEMRRLRKPNAIQRNIFSWIALYRWISGYGQIWQNSLFFIAVCLLVLPLLFPVTGLLYIYPLGTPQEYNADYWHALQYNFLTVTFQKDINDLYHPSAFTRNLAIIESLLMPVLVTLFILALRRRFKR